MLNLNDSVMSLSPLLKTSDKEKLNGPTTVNQSRPIPIELLILLYHLLMNHNQHPKH